VQPFTTHYPWSRRWLPVLLLPVGLLIWLRVAGSLPWLVWIAAVLMVTSVASQVLARLEVDVAGMLTVRGLLPGRGRAVDLSQLAFARAREHATMDDRSSGHRDHPYIVQVLELRDAAGRELRVEPRAWQRADLVVEAVEQAARARGVPIEGGELFGVRPAEGEPAAQPDLAGADAPAPPVPTAQLVVRPRASIRAVAAWFALILGLFGLLFAGLGGLVLGLTLGALGLGLNGFAALPIAGVVWLVLVVAAVVGALRARLTLGPDGRLSVRSWPPWPRHLSLGQLARVEAVPGRWVRAGTLYERTTRVTLTERSGAQVKLMAEAWNDLPVLMPALAAWAQRSGAQVDERTRAYLLLGRKPTAAGTRPLRQV
jgi:hypothetical protein